MNDSFKVVKDYFKEVNIEVNVITTFARKKELSNSNMKNPSFAIYRLKFLKRGSSNTLAPHESHKVLL